MATRRRAFGNIRPAGKSSWQASYKVDGQRFVAPSTFPSKADASAWLANIQAYINRGIWIDPTAGKEFLAQYVEGRLDRKQKTGRYRPRTLELVTGLLLRIILPALGDRELAEIKTPLIRSWHADVAAKHSPGQAAKSYRLLRTILGEATSDGVITFNPCAIKGAGNEAASERPKPTLSTSPGRPRARMVERAAPDLGDRHRPSRPGPARPGDPGRPACQRQGSRHRARRSTGATRSRRDPGRLTSRPCPQAVGG
jgi:hypothetical protein